MSATRDKSQKTTFVYSNLYQIYRKGKEAAKVGNVVSEPSRSLEIEAPLGLSRGSVLKAASVNEYRPPEFIGKRLAKPKVVANNPAIQSLKDNLKNLNDLHARLRFMLQELEALTKK